MFKRRDKAQCGGDCTHDGLSVTCCQSGIFMYKQWNCRTYTQIKGGSAHFVVLIHKTRISKRTFWIRISSVFATCNLFRSKDFYWQNLQHQKNLDGSLSPGTIPLTSVELLQHGIWPRSLYKALFICTMIQIFWYQESFSTEVSPYEICLVLRNISFTFLSNIIC